MKKFFVFLVVFSLCISSAACSAPKNDVTVKEETPVFEEGVVYSYHALATAEDAKNDGFYAVAFDPETDIQPTEDGYSLTVDLFEYDLYNYDDILSLEVGSKITMCQEIFTIETLETDEETGTVTINGGRENGGFVLLAQMFEYRTDNEENGCPYLYSVGSITLPISEDFKYTDNTKPGADGKGIETGIALFPASLDKGNSVISPKTLQLK